MGLTASLIHVRTAELVLKEFLITLVAVHTSTRAETVQVCNGSEMFLSTLQSFLRTSLHQASVLKQSQRCNDTCDKALIERYLIGVNGP